MHQLWLLTEPECKWFQLSSTFCIVKENFARSKKFPKKDKLKVCFIKYSNDYLQLETVAM